MDDAFIQNQRPETPTMDQTAHNPNLRETLQILARLAQACATHKNSTNAKFTVDEMIEWDTQGRNVAAGVGGGKLDSEPLPTGVEHAAEERLDGLYLDQRDFAPSMARLFE